MKKTIFKVLALLIIFCAILSFIISYYFQSNSAKRNFSQSSAYKAEQISQKIQENNELIRSMEENLKQEYLVKARTVSMFLHEHDELIYNQEVLDQYRELLIFEEIHFFDETGTIFAGTHPEYYGYSFDSGEQMAFFAPLLEDRNLGLAQDVTPNTAEAKLMQYVAVWNEDKDMIIQIGHEPSHLIEALETTELSYLLPLMIDDADTSFFAYDNSSQIIVAATNDDFVGTEINSFDYEVVSDTIIEREGERVHWYESEIGDITLVMNIRETVLYENVVAFSLFTTAIVVFITALLVFVIIALLNRIIISPIFTLIEEMERIGKGNLDIEMNINATPEFQSLSDSINKMIKNLLEHDIHTTRLFQSITIPIAMFEYSNASDDVKVTGNIADILPVGQEKMEDILMQSYLFGSLLESMQSIRLEGEDDIFVVESKPKNKYLKIKSYSENNKVWGFIIDMTSELQKQEKIKKERDTDFLTSLSSRRAFIEKTQRILTRGQDFGVLAVLMLDLDNLKYVNDTLGHEYGDTLILTAANLIKDTYCEKKIIARLGGDEFAVVFYEGKSKDDIKRYIEDFRKRVQESFIVAGNGEKIPVSISGGYTFYGDFAHTYNELLRLADAAMYKVKRSAKGSIIEYAPENITGV